MISFREYKDQWTSNIKGDVLSGLVVALALIPEAIASILTRHLNSMTSSNI